MPKPDEPLRVRKISLNPITVHNLSEAWHRSVVDNSLCHTFVMEKDGRQILLTVDDRVPPSEILIEKG